MRRPTFRRLEETLPLDELLVELRKPEVKAAILAETDLPPDPRRQFEGLTENMPYLFAKMFPLGDPPDYEPTADRSDRRHRRSRPARDPWEVLYDCLATGELVARRVHQLRATTGDHLATMIEHADTVIGLSDGGAHVKMICDASMPTYLLTHWVRDRARGERLPLETVIRKQAARHRRMRSASPIGARIEVGKKADLNVIDLDRLHPARAALGRRPACRRPPGRCRTPPATWRRSSAVSSPVATDATPAPDPAGSCAPPTDPRPTSTPTSQPTSARGRANGGPPV